MDLSFILNNLGEDTEISAPSVSPPIYQTSNYFFKTVEDFRSAISSERENWIYSRGNNPTINLLCKKLAALEGAEEALVFSSGMAAISSTVLAMVKSGDHVVCVQHPYSWTDTLMTKNILPKFGVEVTMVDGTDPVNFESVIKPNTRVIYLESPNSWTFQVQDLDAVSALARKHGIVTIIDNSYSTPLYQQPISHGIDLVVHTASKYLGGHSDVVAGVCCGSKTLIDKIFHNEFLTLGGIMSPLNAWLLLRGLRTLEVRMAHITRTTQKVIDFLEESGKVARIYYPFHEQNKLLSIAKKQMTDCSGLFSIELKTNDVQAIEEFCNSLVYWRMAVSWGGYESLIIPSCTFVRPGLYSTLPANMIRFSVGLESADVLIDDLRKNLFLLDQ
ncbi:MAG TPA: aminotransferase class I/II-fold pyridoxal phosphate-dependent enzyme [Bacteroidales bacterium]|jgi:cystathionine beta-lyase/cystathionine gamma-synthase|nr:aminotransferase class I/II-fold pyridoxal phosphate-dependent enzyme [Bacteroidales bacterium]